MSWAAGEATKQPSDAVVVVIGDYGPNWISIR